MAFFSGKIPPMTKLRLPLAGRIAIFSAGIIVLALILYQVPAIHDRLSWRLDFASAYVRGVINPVEQLPTPRVVQAAVLPSETPTRAFRCFSHAHGRHLHAFASHAHPDDYAHADGYPGQSRPACAALGKAGDQ